LATHDKIQFEFIAGEGAQLWIYQWKKIRYQTGDKGQKQTNHDVLENKMSYFPLVAHFFSPARRLAPRPFRSGRLRISSNVSLLLMTGRALIHLSSFGMVISPSSGGKSWIDQLLFIEQNT